MSDDNELAARRVSEGIDLKTQGLHGGLRALLRFRYGNDEAERLIDGAKDAAVDFIASRGINPGHPDYDEVAQTLLECVFMQSPALMGPDGMVA
jgi:hypothetical protein